jgi:endonuclease YncB( thermonuclease family)
MFPKRTNLTTDPRLLRRRRLRTLAYSIIALILFSSLSDRAGLFGYSGDDYSRFNHRAFPVLDIQSGDTFRILADNHSVSVHLLGVDAPDAPTDHWFAESLRYTRARLKDRTITLRLDGTQTRDDSGNLLAYVFITDADNLNADVIRDAQAYADRRIKHTFHAACEQAENEARKKHRGLWRDVTDDQQPAWRRTWLESMRQRRASP